MESFLDEDAEILAIQLSAEERNFKRELFHCFASQKRVLCWFPLNVEKFRLAPVCDFTLPPHEGTLYYEKFPWGMDGARWRDLAREAMAAGQVKNPSVQQDFARA
jgi:hypothetical protein